MCTCWAAIHRSFEPRVRFLTRRRPRVATISRFLFLLLLSNVGTVLFCPFPPTWLRCAARKNKRNLIWFKKRGGGFGGARRYPHGQHNLMRQSVKGTKWITKMQSGLVGGWRMKSVIFQHPWVVGERRGRRRGTCEAVGERRCGWCGVGGRATVPGRRAADCRLCGVVYVEHMGRREAGRTRCRYSDTTPPACLDKQDLHVGFWAGHPGGRARCGGWKEPSSQRSGCGQPGNGSQSWPPRRHTLWYFLNTLDRGFHTEHKYWLN